eukprot:2354587-Rhodomonas_salina.2
MKGGVVTSRTTFVQSVSYAEEIQYSRSGTVSPEKSWSPSESTGSMCMLSANSACIRVGQRRIRRIAPYAGAVPHTAELEKRGIGARSKTFRRDIRTRCRGKGIDLTWSMRRKKKQMRKRGIGARSKTLCSEFSTECTGAAE